MARARNLKPGFFTNEELGECAPLARILFAGLWCLADREGRVEDRPKKLKIELLPYDDCDSGALLQQLHDHELITRYTVDGKNYIQINNFLKHQKPHIKESASTIPAYDEHQPRQVQAPTLAQPSPASCLNPVTLEEGKEPSSCFPVKSKYPVEFEQFWLAYPENRRKEKPNALKAWRVAITQTTADDLILSLAKYSRTREALEGYAPYPAKWLKQERWNENHTEKPTELTHGRPIKPVKQTFASEAERLIARYAAECEDEERENAAGGGIIEGVCSPEIIRQDSG